MRIQIVTPNDPAGLSGNAVTARRWEKTLTTLGHTVHVTGDEETETDLLIALHARKSAAAIRRYRDRAPDRPLIVALTGTDLYRDLQHDASARESVEQATFLIALQGEAQRALPETLHDRIRVVHQSVRIPSELTPPPTDHFAVVVVGHLRDVKDPLRSALAVRDLPTSSRIRVRQYGEALDDEWRERATRETTENPRYRWCGPVSHEDAMRAIASSHLHVLTSQLEGGANVICEAVALGVPTLSSRIDGSMGLLGPDYPGYFAVGETAELRQLLRRAETQNDFYQELVRRCRERAHLLTPEHELATWNGLLREL